MLSSRSILQEEIDQADLDIEELEVKQEETGWVKVFDQRWATCLLEGHGNGALHCSCNELESRCDILKEDIMAGVPQTL